MSSQIKYYWEDMQPGLVRDLGQVSPSVEEIKAFAGQFDPQPFHLDEAATAELDRLYDLLQDCLR